MSKKSKPFQLVEDTAPSPAAVAVPPRGLGEHGTQLWNAVLAEYDVRDIGGLLLLGQCAHAQDMAVRLREQVDADGLMVQMASGLRSHPAIKDELGYRCFISACLKRLGILDEPVKQFGGAYKKYGP